MVLRLASIWNDGFWFSSWSVLQNTASVVVVVVVVVRFIVSFFPFCWRIWSTTIVFVWQPLLLPHGPFPFWQPLVVLPIPFVVVHVAAVLVPIVESLMSRSEFVVPT